MYLSKEDIIKLLPEMNFGTLESTKPDFDPESQIQICSIDLRISCEFWKQKRVKSAIDLDNAHIAELSPARHWKKITLAPGESLIIKPGEFILGHTHEKFYIPKKFAAKINTRSSFARMGLETNSATDFINPGWRGHVPLEIINKSINSIKITPYLSIAQIMITPLSSEPSVQYGDTGLDSKYQDDDGGISYWWRDKLYKEMKKSYTSLLTHETVKQLSEKFKTIDDLGLYRFEKFLSKQKLGTVTTSENLINRFCKVEKRKNKFQNALVWVLAAAFTVSAAPIVREMTSPVNGKYTKSLTVYIVLTIVPIVIFSIAIWYSFIRNKVKYYEEI